MVDPQFTHAISDALHITRIAKGQSPDPPDNDGAGSRIAHTPQPCGELRSLSDLQRHLFRADGGSAAIASVISTVRTLTVVTRFNSSITRSLWSAKR